MSDTLGVELSPDVVRAVALGAWRTVPRGTFEAPWDPERPADLVARLREQVGPVGRVALSVGLGFLHSKHVNLPPAPAAARRRMLALEPDRFFPVQGQPLVVALVDEPDLAFAVHAELVERWTAAFEEWAPVAGVEPAPLSVARVLGASATSGTFAMPAGPGERGLIEVEDGRLLGARRVPGEGEAPQGRALPAVGDVPSAFLSALGAARGVSAPLERMLLSESLAARVKRRRLVRASLTAAVCAASLGLTLWALDRSREGVRERIDGEITAVAARAQEAMTLRDRLAAMDLEAGALTELARRRTDPLAGLAALSERLPREASVLSARVAGDEWRIEGTAEDAAAIIPVLDGDPRFHDVRFLSASARYREGNRTYETFSIAFRVRSPN